MSPTAIGHPGVTRAEGARPVRWPHPVQREKESEMVIGGGLVLLIAVVVAAIMLSKRDT
jgi:hypothetical protein